MKVPMLAMLAMLATSAAMLMDMEPMDPHSESCSGLISSVYAFGGAECTALQSWKRGPCQCKLPDYVQTVVACIDVQMKNVTREARNSTRTMAYQMLISMGCPDENITMSDLEAYHHNVSHLPEYHGPHRTKATAPWPVTGPFIVSDEEAYNALKSYELNNQAEPRNHRFGGALIGYWAGIMLLRFVSVCYSKVFPTVRTSCGSATPVYWLREHFMMPALFGRRSYTKLGFSIPTRSHSFVIFGFVVLVVVFTFAHLPVWSPNYTWTYSNAQMYSSYLGQRSGVLSLYLCPLLFLFAGRNNFLQWLTSWPQDTYVLYHRWIGRAVVFELIVHIIAYNVQRAAAHRYRDMLHTAYWIWGSVSAAFGLFQAFNSLPFFRKRSYEMFLILHIIGAIAFILGGYYHLDLLDEPIGLNFFYAMIAVWAFDRAMRLVRVLTSNPLGWAEVVLHDDAIELVMDRPSSWTVQMRPGVYCFVHIMQSLLFIQSHPFTLLNSLDEPNKIKLLCRVRGGMTRRLAQMALECPTNFRTRVLLDGPYGHSHDLSEFNECVFVAGGIGITTPFAYIQNLLWKYPRGFQKITLLWALRDESALKWFESELQFLAEYPRVDVQLYISKSASKQARQLDIIPAVHELMAASKGPMSVLCCGPGSMNNDARHAVATGLHLTRNFVDYFEESFSF